MGQTRYFAIRVGNTVMFRKTVGTISVVRSVLRGRTTDFWLEQTTYVGGRPAGSLGYTRWRELGGGRIRRDGYLQISKQTYRGLDPYITQTGRIKTDGHKREAGCGTDDVTSD